MKVGQNFTVLYIILVICQVVLSNYANLGPYIMLSILPAMIMCIPLSVGTFGCMLITFATGLSVDWLSEGLIGINAASLLPVAFARKTFIRIFLGEDMISRQDSFSIRKNGAGKISTVMIAASVIFLVIYVILDGAGTRPFWFCATKVAVSLIANTALALLITDILCPNDRK